MELGRLFLIKLRTQSNYRKITFLLLIVAILFSIPRLLVGKKSNLDNKETVFYGYVTKYSKTDNYISFEIKLKDRKNEIVKGVLYQDIKLQYHDYIKVEGVLKKITGYHNFSCFSYSKWAEYQNMHYTIDIKNIEMIKKNENLLYILKNKIVSRINNIGSSSYLFALLLGDDSKIDRTVKKSYQENGVSHLFALSGMHLSFLIAILTYLFKKIRLKKNISEALIFIVLAFYLFLTSFSVSLLRAYLFVILKEARNKSEKGENKVFPFIQTFSILLLINPFYLFDVGFLYSFTISFAILITRFKLKKISSKILSSILLSFLSFFVSLPISIYYFHQVNILGIFYNLFFISFVSLLLFPCSFLVFLFPCISWLYHLLITILEEVSLFLSDITIGIFIMRHPSFYLLIIIVLVVSISLYLFLKRIRYCVLVISLFLLFYTNCNLFLNENYVTVLDVGQGDSLLMSLNNKNVLIDTGGKLNTSLSENVTVPYLKSRGIRKLDFLLLTHGDYDHMGEAINLVENFKVEKVIFNCGEFNELEQELIKALDKKKIPYYSCIKELNIENNKLYFLNNKDYGNENDNSSVVYTELNGYKFMFMGDAGVEVEEDLIEKYNLKDIDVLKVGHHGSKTSSSKEFIDEIIPKYSIISVGKNNRYGHPNKEVLDNLEHSKIYRTDQDGSIMFEISNNKLKIDTCNP